MVKDHGLARRHPLPPVLLVRPQLNGGTLGGRPKDCAATMSKNFVDRSLALGCVLLMGSVLSCGKRPTPALRSRATLPPDVKSAESAQAANSPSVPHEPNVDQKSALLITIEDWDLTGSCLAHMVAATLTKAGYIAWPQHLEETDLRLYASATKISGKVHLALQGSFFREGIPLLPDLYFATVIDGRQPPTQLEVDALVRQVLDSPALRAFLAHGRGIAGPAQVLPVSADSIRAACRP